MGFLSFLSRKGLADKPQGDALLITQAYHSTKAATAPVRGTYPVGGNGKTDLETLAKARGLNPAQSLSLLRPDDGAAPAPLVPLYHFDSAGRPSSAPNAAFTAAAVTRPKRAFAASLGVASRRQSLIPEPRPTSSATSLQSGSGESKVRAQSISSYQQRLPSISSSGSGHKDILDAQSELTPSDFKSRVRATGARDFGEDVADRNIQENGCHPDSPAVQAFYRHDLYEDAPRKPGSMASVSRPYRRDSSLQKPASVQSGLRTVSLNSPLSRNNSLKRRASSRLSQAPSKRASIQEEHLDKRPISSGGISRRQSLKGKRRSELGRVSSIRSQASPLVHQKGGSSPGSPMRLATHFPELLVDSGAPSSPGLRIPSPTTRPGFANTSSLSTIRPSSGQRLRKEILPSNWTDEKPAKKGLPLGQRAFPLVDASKEMPRRCSSAVFSTKAFVTELSPPPTPPPMGRSSVSSAGYHTANSSLSYASSHHSKPSITGPVGHLTSTSEPYHDTESAPSPSVKIASNPMDEFGTVPDIRTPHLPASLRKLQLDDFRASQALRSSSLRNMSVSSTTPTSSDTSSYSHHSTPLQRPVSRHTAQTSVDLDPLSTLTKHSNTSQDSFIFPGQSPTLSSAVPPVPTVAFDMVDYISSDDDSLEPQRPRGQDETELLFSDTGYGEGFQLPGLFDTLAVTQPPHSSSTEDDRPTRPGSSQGLPLDYGPRVNVDLTSLYSSPTLNVNRNRFALTTAADSEDEDDDWTPAETGYSAHPGVPPSSPGRGMRTLSALGGVSPVAEEQRDKLSAQDAIRMRKEAKVRKRASGFGIKTREWPQKGKGKEAERNDDNWSEVQS